MLIYTAVLLCTLTHTHAHPFRRKWNPKLRSRQATSITHQLEIGATYQFYMSLGAGASTNQIKCKLI